MPASPIVLPSREVSKGHVPLSEYDEVAAETYLGPAGSQGALVNKQGLKLKAYYWPAQTPKAALVFVHGHGGHMHFELLKFTDPGRPLVYEGSWVAALNAAGISVSGIDNQGNGRSEAARGLRFFVESFDDYVDDVLQLARQLKEGGQPGFGGLPLFIGGISMGGCIAYKAALTQPDLFAGAVLLAPMLSLDRVSRRGLNPYLRPLSALLSRLVPGAPIVATDKNALYPDIQAAWDADPLTLHMSTRVRNANEYLRTCEVVMAGLESTRFPFIVFHSERDTMCDPDGSKQLYLRAQSEDKSLRLVNTMWHVLVKEPGHEQVLQGIIDWILARA